MHFQKYNQTNCIEVDWLFYFFARWLLGTGCWLHTNVMKCERDTNVILILKKAYWNKCMNHWNTMPISNVECENWQIFDFIVVVCLLIRFHCSNCLICFIRVINPISIVSSCAHIKYYSWIYYTACKLIYIKSNIELFE